VFGFAVFLKCRAFVEVRTYYLITTMGSVYMICKSQGGAISAMRDKS